MSKTWDDPTSNPLHDVMVLVENEERQCVDRSQDIIVDSNGTVRAIFNDDLFSALSADAERVETRRASHVEPIPGGPWWRADMSPVGGPVLGPYATRWFALKREVEWLRAHDLPIPADAEGGSK